MLLPAEGGTHIITKMHNWFALLLKNYKLLSDFDFFSGTAQDGTIQD